LGWSYAECWKHYGQPRNLGLNKSGLQEQAFDVQRYSVIAVFGKDGTVISVRYLTRDHDALNDSMIQKLLFQNAGTLEPGVDIFWSKGEQAADGTVRYEAYEGQYVKKPALRAAFWQEEDLPARSIGGFFYPATYFWTLEIDSSEYLRIIEELEKAAAKNL
jgi:hypothetical protein